VHLNLDKHRCSDCDFGLSIALYGHKKKVIGNNPIIPI